jgi:hypothetical protein
VYYHQPFHNPTSVEHLKLDWKVEYTNANQGIMLEAHNIWVQYMQSEENDLDNTFQRRIPSFSVWDFRWTPPNQIFQFQKRLPARKAISTISSRCKIQQWVIVELAIVWYSHIASRSGLELNHSYFGNLWCQYTWTINSSTVQWQSPIHLNWAGGQRVA